MRNSQIMIIYHYLWNNINLLSENVWKYARSFFFHRNIWTDAEQVIHRRSERVFGAVSIRECTLHSNIHNTRQYKLFLLNCMVKRDLMQKHWIDSITFITDLQWLRERQEHDSLVLIFLRTFTYLFILIMSYTSIWYSRWVNWDFSVFISGQDGGVSSTVLHILDSELVE